MSLKEFAKKVGQTTLRPLCAPWSLAPCAWSPPAFPLRAGWFLHRSCSILLIALRSSPGATSAWPRHELHELLDTQFIYPHILIFAVVPRIDGSVIEPPVARPPLVGTSTSLKGHGQSW